MYFVLIIFGTRASQNQLMNTTVFWGTTVFFAIIKAYFITSLLNRKYKIALFVTITTVIIIIKMFTLLL